MSMFDLKAAREELSRIDDAWTDGEYGGAYNGARALLDKALAALEAGWPVVDLEGAAVALWCATAGDTAETWAETPDFVKCDCYSMVRAVLAYAGRKVETVERAPVAITDAMVEEAAKRAWCAPNAYGVPMNAADRFYHSEEQLGMRRNEARAVLEYAASLGGVAPTVTTDIPQGSPMGPICDVTGMPRIHIPAATDARQERLVRYRCAALPAVMSSPVDASKYDNREALMDDIASRAELWAHAMLAAEKEPARG